MTTGAREIFLGIVALSFGVSFGYIFMKLIINEILTIEEFIPLLVTCFATVLYLNLRVQGGKG